MEDFYRDGGIADPCGSRSINANHPHNLKRPEKPSEKATLSRGTPFNYEIIRIVT